MVSSLVGIFKNDISNVRIVSEALGVNTEYMSILIALACKRLSLVTESLPMVANIIEFDNLSAFKFILKLA